VSPQTAHGPAKIMTELNLALTARMLDAVSSASPQGIFQSVVTCAARRGSLGRRVLTIAAAGAMGGLVLFHLALLYSRIVEGRLLEPAVALRWCIGLVLVASIVALHRMGAPLFHGRRALVVWLLVMLLHVSAAEPASLSALTSTSPRETALALFILPAAGAAVCAAAGLILLTALAGRRLIAAPARSWHLLIDRAEHIPFSLATPALASRAPPVRAW
jgi:hypothetical protein